jgi:hypothetical protein
MNDTGNVTASLCCGGLDLLERGPDKGGYGRPKGYRDDGSGAAFGGVLGSLTHPVGSSGS